jgi:aminobenzoyl-glutamate utilization protein B
MHIGLHTWPVTACGGMSIGDKSSLKTAQILAACRHDLMTDPDLRAAAMEDFRRRLGEAPLAAAGRPHPAARARPALHQDRERGDLRG